MEFNPIYCPAWVSINQNGTTLEGTKQRFNFNSPLTVFIIFLFYLFKSLAEEKVPFQKNVYCFRNIVCI